MKTAVDQRLQQLRTLDPVYREGDSEATRQPTVLDPEVQSHIHVESTINIGLHDWFEEINTTSWTGGSQ